MIAMINTMTVTESIKSTTFTEITAVISAIKPVSATISTILLITGITTDITADTITITTVATSTGIHSTVIGSIRSDALIEKFITTTMISVPSVRVVTQNISLNANPVINRMRVMSQLGISSG